MVLEIKKDDHVVYQCKECGFNYPNEGLAKKCEAWCKEHNSCSIEITKHAITPDSEDKTMSSES